MSTGSATACVISRGIRDVLLTTDSHIGSLEVGRWGGLIILYRQIFFVIGNGSERMWEHHESAAKSARSCVQEMPGNASPLVRSEITLKINLTTSWSPSLERAAITSLNKRSPLRMSNLLPKTAGTEGVPCQRSDLSMTSSWRNAVVADHTKVHSKRANDSMDNQLY